MLRACSATAADYVHAQRVYLLCRLCKVIDRYPVDSLSVNKLRFSGIRFGKYRDIFAALAYRPDIFFRQLHIFVER